MISIVKGKTEISLNLQKVLNPFFPLLLTGAEERDHSENGLSDQARRRSGLFLERIRRAVWLLVDFISNCRNPTFFFSCKGPTSITRPDIHLLHKSLVKVVLPYTFNDFRRRLSLGQPVSLETVYGCIAKFACRVPRSARTDGKIVGSRKSVLFVRLLSFLRTGQSLSGPCQLPSCRPPTSWQRQGLPCFCFLSSIPVHARQPVADSM